MANIKVMTETLSNKIAAGEVVERPRSIVKELVENALDAQADFIKISIENAGISSISVEDNGKGMNPEDAILSFQRHATSKIFTEDDLFTIHTLGFRGEALAAISSVSKVHLHTGQAGAASTHVQIEGGEVLETKSDNEREGTLITIRQLFYNTPARLKHLKSVQTEYMHILEYLQKMALARPDVRFEFIQDGRSVFKTYGSGKIEETLSMIYGEKIANYFFPLAIEDNDFKITGIITHPQMQRSSNKVINLSINQRSVRHYGINRSIISGYGNLIPKGMYPIVALDIEVDTKLVDVNVHPAKLEVRLSQERQLEDLVKKAIEETLMSENLIYRDTTGPRKIKSSEQFSLSLENANVGKTQAIQEEPSEYTAGPRKLFNYPNGADKKPITVYSGSTLSSKEQQLVKDLVQPITEPSEQENTVASNDYPQPIIRRTTQDAVSVPSNAEHSQKPVDVVTQEKPSEAVMVLRELSIIGQYDATYILAQRNASLYLIDQHAAQERIKYEEHMSQVRNMEKIVTQELLFPLTIHLEGKELVALKAYLPELERAGIEVEFFGDADIRINCVPSWIQQQDIEVYVRKSIDCLTANNSVDSALVREKQLIMLSCKYSIKAHDILSTSEMEALIYRLSEMETPYTCPHGRPIVIEHTKYEVERWFKRV